MWPPEAAMALSARSEGPMIANDLPGGANAADAAANDSHPATTRPTHSAALAGVGQPCFCCSCSIIIEMLDANASRLKCLRDRHQLVDLSTDADAPESRPRVERQREQRP